jgi:hypothetical protein
MGGVGARADTEFRVTAGLRRISRQQLQPLEELKRTNPEYPRPGEMEGVLGRAASRARQRQHNPGLPRSESEIRRAASSFRTAACAVKTNGQRLESPSTA